MKGTKVRTALATMPNIAGSYRDTYIPGYIKYSGLQAINKPFGTRALLSLVIAIPYS